MEARISRMPIVDLVLLLVILEVQSQNISLPGYTMWAVPLSPRDDMFCADTCIGDVDYDRCCTCESKPCWQINATACDVVVEYLSLEYIDIFGSTIIIDNNQNHVDVHVLEHTHGRLTELPGGICDYNDTLSYIDLSYNLIDNVDRIKCLGRLDTLILNNNRITSVDNTTFSEMEYLRVLSLANNEIEVLNPNTIKTNSLANIHSVNFSGNSLTQTDVTNVFREGVFCSLSFANSDLGNITNINNMLVDLDKSYGPGDTYLDNTNLGKIFDFTLVGITDYSSISLFLKGQIHIDSGSVHCDCSIVPLFRGLGNNVLDYWPDLGDPNGIDFICQSPPSMKGVDLKDVLRSGDYGNMTCRIVVNCTDGCICTDKPSDDIVIVDCRNRHLDLMPENIPIGKFNTRNVRLLLDHNNIRSLDDRDYLERIKYLEMPNNPLGMIVDSAAKKLKSADIMTIENQRLNALPRNFRQIDPNKVVFGNHPVNCDCDNLWIGNWIRSNGAFDRLYCQTKSGIVYAEDVNADTLGCLESNNFLRDLAIILGVLCFLLLLIALSIKFKTEIFLLKRRLFRTKVFDEPVVFLSMCENNDDIFALVHYCVRPSLKHLNIQVRTPWYDCEFGEIKEAHLSKAVTESDVFVIFLCEMYLERQQSVEEFEAIWKAFLLDSSKNILIINWSGEDTSDTSDKRMRALFRTGYGMQFEAQDDRLMKRIARKVNPKLDAETIPEQFQTFPRDHKPAQVEPEEGIVNGEDNTEEPLEEKSEPTPHRNKQVHERLSVPKGESLCNCKYRKCYVHMHRIGDSSFYDIPNRKFKPSL